MLTYNIVGIIMTTNSIVNGNEVVHTRFINASREDVFDAWVNPHKLDKWWGPDGFTITNLEVNMQAAGCWRFIMHGPDGTDYPNRVVYSVTVALKPSFSAIFFSTSSNTLSGVPKSTSR